MVPKDPPPQRVLIVDSDSDGAAEIITGYEDLLNKGGKIPVPVFVDTVRGSQIKLSDRSFAYLAVFVCPEIGTPSWIAVVRACHKYRAGIPIFIIHDKKTHINQVDLEGLGVAGFVEKPLSYGQILDLVGITGGEELPLPSHPLNEKSPAGEESKSDDEDEGPSDNDVIEVDLTNIAGRIKSAFDIFVRLEPGRYVKVLKAGDILSADRIESYREGGALALYILQTGQDSYLDFCDAMVHESLRDATVPIQVKTAQVLAQGESTLRLLRDVGFTERTIERAQVYVGNTVEMVKQISEQSSLIRDLLFDIASVEHAVGSAIFAGLLIKHIGASNPAVFNGVGLACFLHDVSLLGQSPEVRDEDEAQMSPEQLTLFRQHPGESARLVLKIPQVPKSVVMAIAQHHMRLDGSGFPHLKPGEEINRLSELIGISEDFLRLADRVRDVPDFNPVQALYTSAYGKYSQPIIDAFTRTFAEK